MMQGVHFDPAAVFPGPRPRPQPRPIVENRGLDNDGNQRPQDDAYLAGLGSYFDSSLGSSTDRLRAFVKYVPRADLLRLLTLYDIHKLVLEVPGAIIECGVHLGAGLMTWAQLSSIFEPINHTRRIVGFDTFCGFPEIGDEDAAENAHLHAGGLAANALADLRRAIALYDMTRPINHIPRVKLVAGDAAETMPRYLEQHPHTVVSLLRLDFDLFAPTKLALETFVPRMPKGAVIVFDELDDPRWPGETLAVLDRLNLRDLAIRRFAHQPQISYVQLGT